MASDTLTTEQAGVPDHFGRGTNQMGVRLYNERLVLSLIRRHQKLPKADIARTTGLSPQTISIIINQLTRDGLLSKGSPQRGRIGQPSVPYSLNPTGAFSIGLKIGRRSADLVLIDFVGNVRAQLHEPYAFAEPAFILDFLVKGTRQLADQLTTKEYARLAGIGIASPFELWNWENETGAPRQILDRWRNFDIKAEATRNFPWPVYYYNDATAACAAELMLGNPAHHLDFLYMFIGAFIGGGVVLNGNLFPGRTGYAGAIGPMPILESADAKSGHQFRQLLHKASIFQLAEKIVANGGDPKVLWAEHQDWTEIDAPLEDWISDVASSLAQTIVAATSIIDFQAIIIDGGFPQKVRDEIIARTTQKTLEFNRQGLVPVEIIAGAVGRSAPAIGGACLPLLANFTQDREVLFKDIV